MTDLWAPVEDTCEAIVPDLPSHELKANDEDSYEALVPEVQILEVMD